MSQARDPAELPTGVRTRLAHASAQAVAELVGADVLHIKGASVDPELNPDRPEGSDADVLVRPAHLARYMTALQEHGWSLWCDFDEGSLFEHAASLHHAYLGMLDVHQNFPGLHRNPAGAFDQLWSTRVERDIGGFGCAALGRVDEHLVLLLHAARSPSKQLDIANHWDRLEEAEQAEIRQEATVLQATVGLEAALGNLDAVTSPEADLWRLSLSNEDRLGEWWARWRNADSLRQRVALVRRAARVNRFQLGQTLGRPPTRADVRREWWRRAGAGARGLTDRLRRPGRS